MHKTSYHLPQLALVAAALWSLATPVGAGPIVAQDPKQPADAVVDTSKLVPDDDIPNWDKPLPPSGTTPGPAKPANPPTPPAANQAARPTKPEAAPAPTATAEQPGVGANLRNSLKETVRPVYDQLVESGAIDTVHSVKEGLGLDKNQWRAPSESLGEPKATGQWDTPEAAHPAKTAAQAQMDRELAGMMRERLIDQVTPWVAGLVGLYLLGYFIKLLMGYVRWKTARRNARLAQQAKRHAARRSHRTGPRTAASPLGDTNATNSDSQESA